MTVSLPWPFLLGYFFILFLSLSLSIFILLLDNDTYAITPSIQNLYMHEKTSHQTEKRQIYKTKEPFRLLLFTT